MPLNPSSNLALIANGQPRAAAPIAGELSYIEKNVVNISGDTMTGALTLPQVNITNADGTFDLGAANIFQSVTDTSATVNVIDIALTGVTLFAGLTLLIKVANTNTGAVTLSFNGGTAQNVFGQGVALSPHALMQGDYILVVWNGTDWDLINFNNNLYLTFQESNTYAGSNTFSGNNTFSGSNTFSGNNSFSGTLDTSGTLQITGPYIFTPTSISGPLVGQRLIYATPGSYNVPIPSWATYIEASGIGGGGGGYGSGTYYGGGGGWFEYKGLLSNLFTSWPQTSMPVTVASGGAVNSSNSTYTSIPQYQANSGSPATATSNGIGGSVGGESLPSVNFPLINLVNGGQAPVPGQPYSEFYGVGSGYGAQGNNPGYPGLLIIAFYP